MEDIKLTLTHAVAGKLTAAPDGPAKDELVEELSDNLYHRFLDMTGAGVSEQEAFDRAMDDLGDVLLAYLGVEQPRQGDNGPVVINIHGGEDKSQDVQRIVINDAGETKVINPHGEDAEAARKEAEAARTEAEAAWEKAEAGPERPGRYHGQRGRDLPGGYGAGKGRGGAGQGRHQTPHLRSAGQRPCEGTLRYRPGDT